MPGFVKKLQPENWFLPQSSSFFLKIRLKWKSRCCIDLKKKTAALCIFFKTLTSTSATSEYAWGLLSVLLLESAHLPASVTVCPVGCVCSSVRSGCRVSWLIEAHCYCVPRRSGLMSPPTHARLLLHYAWITTAAKLSWILVRLCRCKQPKHKFYREKKLQKVAFFCFIPHTFHKFFI